MTDHPRIFVYAPQRRAVIAMLEPFLTFGGPREVVAVSERHQLMGLEDGTFVEITNHGHQIPLDIDHVINAMGFVRWRLDDSNCRRKYEDRARSQGIIR